MTRFPDGSISSIQRLEAATVRALDAHMTLERKAERLCDELDQATNPGVVRAPLSDEDSLVIAIRDVTQERGS